MINFAHATALDDRQHGVVHPSWTQGRSAFGGIGAGLALSAISPLIPEGRRLRSLSIQFTAPMAPGTITTTASINRSGRSVTQAHAEVHTGDQLAVSVLATVAADRSSDIHIQAQSPPEIASCNDCMEMPYIEGVTPIFTQHFRYHWATLDSLPFQGGGRPNIEGYVSFREPTVPNAAAVLALIDSWPAPVLGMVSRPIAASTVTWMVNLYAKPDPALDQTFRFSSTATVAGNGYSDMDGRLWDSRGRLIATSRQFVAEFSGK